MQCPHCSALSTRIARTDGGNRRRECRECGHVWNTVEVCAGTLKRLKDTAEIAHEAIGLALHVLP